MAFKKLNQKNVKKLSELDLQQKNRWKFFIFPSQEAFTNFSPAGVGLGLAGNLVTTLYLVDIDFPGSLTFNYESSGAAFYLKGITHPEEITMSFLEDENATVWRYMNIWRKSIAFVEPWKADTAKYGNGAAGAVSAANTLISSDVSYVFADNQRASERIGMLLFGDGADKKFSKFPRIMFYGLKFKAIGDMQASNSEGGAMKITVQMSVREIAAPVI